MFEQKRKIFFTGGEGINWALDHDLIHLRRLTTDFVVESSLKECDIIHSVWWRGLLGIPADILRRKVVVASIADSPVTVLRTPEFARSRDLVSSWLVEYAEAQEIFSRVGLPCLRFPDPIDTEMFSKPANRPSARSVFCEKHSIDPSSFLVGNFHRDSSMFDLGKPKKQKGADLLLELLLGAREGGVPIHAVLAGPRRHWIIGKCREFGIPFTYVGKETTEDDLEVNTMNLSQIAGLYGCLDLYLVSSRWEGAPNAVLEAAATHTPIIGTPVGQIPDILPDSAIFEGFVDGVALLKTIYESGYPSEWSAHAELTVRRWNSDEALASRLRHIYETASRMDRKRARSKLGKMRQNLGHNRATRIFKRKFGHRLPEEDSKLRIALWHDFHPPPYGGGNQFMIALEKELQRRGAKTQRNDGVKAHAHILQGIWFDEKKLMRERSSDSVILHRVDGPIQLYRGPGHEVDDERCYEINRRCADCTIMQGIWSMLRTYDLGFSPIRPTIVRNAADPEFFFPRSTSSTPDWNASERKIRLISTSWSDNPRKGLDFYQFLDEHLDFERFSYTFVGRLPGKLKNIEVKEPVGSAELGGLLREHDIYITASRLDPCSNALIEALASRLPVLYYSDGGHPELAEFGGLGFSTREQMLINLEQIVAHYDHFRRLIWPNPMKDVVDTYLSVIRNTASIL